MMTNYLYRRGNGNDGNYARCVVTLTDRDDPYAALRALTVNDYIAGKKVRRHIQRTIDIYGEPEFGVYASVYDGPDGETEFGAAYLTSELQPLDDKDFAHYRDTTLPYYDTLEACLDAPAWRLYRKTSKLPKPLR